MSTQLEITEAKLRLDELLTRARHGEEIVLADGGKPVVRISPCGELATERVFGEFFGRIHVRDSFMLPLDDAALAEWEK